MQSKPSFLTLLLLISFASINAVLPTPALPAISQFFGIAENTTQQIITWFLVGYALGQLIYGPIANRFGRKPALYSGIGLQIFSSLLCVYAGVINHYSLLPTSRFLAALGSGVGLKMTYTIVNESYEPQVATQKVSYLMLSFAIAPGLSIALGGILSTHFGWQSCFIASAIYGLILLLMTTRLPETKTELHLDAFKWKHLVHGYVSQFKNPTLIRGAILLGGGTCFTYVFAAVAPFLAIDLMGMKPSAYGMANILPSVGLVLGSIFSANLSKKHSPHFGILLGILMGACSSVLISLALALHEPPLVALFLPMIINYFGLALIISNASTFAMSQVEDKAHGSAVMSFINMGIATIAVLSLSFLPVTKMLLPATFGLVVTIMLVVFSMLRAEERPSS
ncbi:MAG: MFS transporter [Verrucomicrobia bacterium]|nr:MAG: MFS transporter [Verrucomicrobiota bacterium]